MATVTEIEPNLYRISVHISAFNLQFNHFLVMDDEPLLFHSGLKGCFPELRTNDRDGPGSSALDRVQSL